MKRKTRRSKSSKLRSINELLGAEAPNFSAAGVCGRLKKRAGRWSLYNARAEIQLEPSPGAKQTREAWQPGALVAVDGEVRVGASDEIEAAGNNICVVVSAVRLIHAPQTKQPALEGERGLSLGAATRLRHEANQQIRRFFQARDFLEVETPYWVPAAGTDVHLAPVDATFQDPHLPASQALSGQLHTSPEFSMKRLLCAGFERIWQLGKVWRNGEITPLHNPEFTLLEWYRAWEDLDAIIQDVEDLSRALLGARARVGAREISLKRPFLRMTMQEVVQRACGFDLLEAAGVDALVEACRARDLLSARSLERAATSRRWDELFFELQISYIDPFLLELGPVFVTEWPAQLAVLARKNPDDPRVAQRFELYIGGVELANGFQELTDPKEQRRRFEEDLATRRAAGLPEPPMPERFLEALEWGLPPSSGVAVGVDRYLMLKSGAEDIREVLPFAMRRDPVSGAAQFS